VTTHIATGNRTAPQTLTLIVISISQFVIALDYSIVYVALPSMGADLAMTEASLQWVVSSYAILFAGLLLLGGRVVDKLGGRRAYIFSVTVFGVASLLGGIAQDSVMLLLARALQGTAAAALLPAVLSLLSRSFPTGPERSSAYAIWGAVGASGLASGVVLGGILTTFSWRWTFFINLPLILVCVIGAFKAFENDRRVESLRVPALSSLMGTAAVLLVGLFLTLLADPDTAPAVLFVCLLMALAAVATFLINEHRSANPLIERPLRRLACLRAGSGAAALYMASVGTEFFLVTLFLQEHRGYLPLAAGLAFLPLAVMVTVGNVAAGRLIEARGVRVTLSLGFGIAAAGLVLLAFCLGIESFWIGLLPGFLISGLGHGVIYTALFVLGTSDAPGIPGHRRRADHYGSVRLWQYQPRPARVDHRRYGVNPRIPSRIRHQWCFCDPWRAARPNLRSKTATDDTGSAS